LYLAVLHQQLPLDVVVEEDAVGGGLSDYQLLFLTDQHVSRAASRAIATWVAAGGRILATAGAGMLDDLGHDNQTLRDLFGITPQPVEAPDDGVIRLEKQDLPFATSMDTVSWKT